METEKHLRQLTLMLELTDWAFLDRPDVYATGNMTIFFSPEQLKQQDFRGPDFFVVIGTERRPRNSWVVWEEGGRFPDVIIELLSKSTRANDLGPKKQIYQDVFRTPEYYAFDPERGELFAFHLSGGRYEQLSPDARGWIWSERLGHFLGVREGQLRLFTREGKPVPTAVERGLMAEAAQQRAGKLARKADEEARKADEEARRADEEARRGKEAARKADEEARRADEEARRADEEARR
ncbi:MAG TPA: Uma2 family endonuclease, partial [Candidatus Nanopelagicales bacterium]|nr:Uma2 family endonuclease [Candidatus Nanopelagicales bacterium]